MLVAATLAVIALSVEAEPASADSSCSDYLCVWGQNDYAGCKKIVENDQGNWSNVGWATCSGNINDKVNALKNRHYECWSVVYAGTQWTGHSIQFHSTLQGGIQEDPRLSNGGGYGQYKDENWANRISSNDYCG